MIPTNILKHYKKAQKYKINPKIIQKNTKEAFADLYFAENENYVILYSLLEDIEFAIFNGECRDVKEVKDFIAKYKDLYVYPHNDDYDLDVYEDFI